MVSEDNSNIGENAPIQIDETFDFEKIKELLMSNFSLRELVNLKKILRKEETFGDDVTICCYSGLSLQPLTGYSIATSEEIDQIAKKISEIISSLVQGSNSFLDIIGKLGPDSSFQTYADSDETISRFGFMLSMAPVVVGEDIFAYEALRLIGMNYRQLIEFIKKSSSNGLVFLNGFHIEAAVEPNDESEPENDEEKLLGCKLVMKLDDLCAALARYGVNFQCSLMRSNGPAITSLEETYEKCLLCDMVTGSDIPIYRVNDGSLPIDEKGMITFGNTKTI